MKCFVKFTVASILLLTLVSCEKASDKAHTPASAESRSSKEKISSSGFDGEMAFEYLRSIVELGPRPSGSQAIVATQKFILETLRRGKVVVEEDPFLAATPIGPVSMNNLIAKIPGASPDAIILAGHYDTKRFDTFRFVGANDGGSSSAFLLELAQVLAHRKNPFTIWCVFFDGEEAVREWTDTDSLYGSRHLVQRLKAGGQLSKIRAMILVDMIGDRDLDILKESNSTPWLIDLLWSGAAELGYQKNFLPQSFAIGGDDHFPFLREGIPAVDLIDFDYGFSNIYWHSERDTLDKCSARSLQIVGDTILRSLPRIESRLSQN